MARVDGADRLDGWKAIAAFFGRDERTVKRWEGSRGLPVHRIPGGGRAAVWADTTELRRWLDGPAAGVASMAPVERRIDRRWAVLGLGAVLTAGLTGGAWLTWRPRRNTGHPSGVEAYSDDPATQAIYMRAVLAWDSRTPNGLAAAVRDLNEVIRRQPDRPEGHAKLADCYLLLREFGAMPEGEAYDRAEAAAREALRVAPNDVGALRALAFIRFWWRAEPEALELFDRALKLQPQSVQTRQWYANALSARGRHREALAQFRAARMLQPTDVSLSAAEAQTRAAAGEVAAARLELQQLAAVYPRSISVHRSAAAVALMAGDAGAYLREEEIEAGLRDDPVRIAALKAVRQAFDRGGARAMFAALAEAEAGARRAGRGNAVMTAYFWALAGDTAQARQWLRQARAAREPDLIYLPALPELVRLRA